MTAMFSNALEFNQNIGMWDVSSVSYFNNMFYGAKAFNQDISDWKTGNAVDMKLMFFGALEFNQDVGVWDVNSVTNFDGMFYGAQAFNQNLCDWKPLPTATTVDGNSPTLNFLFETACEEKVLSDSFVCQSCADSSSPSA